MAKKDEKTPLVKKGYVQSFNIVGEAKISDYTFKIDEHSTSSDWIYNQMNLYVYCGEKFGNCQSELMGGYGAERDTNVVYVHGKKDDKDDFSNQYQIDWEDRFDESILEDIGDLCFITVGLEKDTNGKTVYKKFLTPYDAIAYTKEVLKEGMVVNIKGSLKYSIYNGKLQCKKEVTSIVLSNATPDKYRATFTQTILVDSDSVDKKTIDKERGTFEVDAYLLEKLKSYNGWDLTSKDNKGGQIVPLRKQFEFALKEKDEVNNKVIEKFFKPKKNTVTQMTVVGNFVESGATVQATEDDLSDEIKELIDMGMLTLEEALTKCAGNQSKEKRMIITAPQTKMIGEDDDKHLSVVITKEMYTEDDLDLYFLVPKDEDEDDASNEVEESADDEDISDDEDLEALLADL